MIQLHPKIAQASLGYDFTVEGAGLDRICRNGHVQAVLEGGQRLSLVDHRGRADPDG